MSGRDGFMYEGQVIRAYSGYYYVKTREQVLTCTIRGRFKKERFTLLVGDYVRGTVTGEGTGVIEEILPRQSLLPRPMVANVHQVVITFAARRPDLNLALLDRFLVLAEQAALVAIICMNKADLVNPGELDKPQALYRGLGYPVVITSAKTGEGVGDLRVLLTGKTTAFAGPSGVGKSTLLNAVQPGLALVTGEVSEKIKRGKHTTRYAELLPLAGGGQVVDTPGFSLLEFTDLAPEELGPLFPEFRALEHQCKFTGCLHWREPHCAVKQAVADGTLDNGRYEHYLEFLQEIKAQKRGY